MSNVAAGFSDAPITHEDVLEAGKRAGPELAKLIERVVATDLSRVTERSETSSADLRQARAAERQKHRSDADRRN